MAKNIENFRDELVKFANIVENIEDTFLGNDPIEIISYLEENIFEQILY